MQIVNLTQHTITLIGPGFRQASVPPNLPPAEVITAEPVREAMLELDGIVVPIVRTSTAGGVVVGLPDPRDGILYAVPRQVAEASPDRSDLVIPGYEVQDEAGRIVGCRSLARPAPGAGGGEPEWVKVYVSGFRQLGEDDELIPTEGDLGPNTDLKDQTDTPHGWLLVHRRDQHGWYIRHGQCQGRNHFARCPCSSDDAPCDGYEMVEDYVGDHDESYVVCSPCWEATSDER